MLTFYVSLQQLNMPTSNTKKNIAHLKATIISLNYQLPGRANASFCCDIDDIVGYAQLTLTII